MHGSRVGAQGFRPADPKLVGPSVAHTQSSPRRGGCARWPLRSPSSRHEHPLVSRYVRWLLWVTPGWGFLITDARAFCTRRYHGGRRPSRSKCSNWDGRSSCATRGRSVFNRGHTVGAICHNDEVAAMAGRLWASFQDGRAARRALPASQARYGVDVLADIVLCVAFDVVHCGPQPTGCRLGGDWVLLHRVQGSKCGAVANGPTQPLDPGRKGGHCGRPPSRPRRPVCSNLCTRRWDALRP